MKILHLANDYSGSAVYKNLCEALDRHGLQQIIYVGVRSEDLVYKNEPNFSVPQSSVIYRNILTLYTRVNFKHKIKKLKRDILGATKILEFDCIHAHTWYSDGGVAYELYQQFGIPYIVTVRSTDFNLFFKYLCHLRPFGLRILQNAHRIIFIAPSFKEKLFSSAYYQRYISSLLHKSIVIPNGIDDFWVRYVDNRKSFNSHVLKLIYIGRFLKRKNLIRTMKAVQILNAKGIPCCLTLVGGGGNDHDRVVATAKSHPNAHYLGSITDKEELRRVLKDNHVFIMPSKNETFGLVYIEALSQGLPIIYTVNDGIYGFYSDSIGEAVQWSDVEGIVDAVAKIYRNYDQYKFNPDKIVANHLWSNIAQKYTDIYRSIF